MMGKTPHIDSLARQGAIFTDHYGQGSCTAGRAAFITGQMPLRTGETMRFVNDHDPLPLLDQLSQRYGEAVEIGYRQREPGSIVIDFVKKQ